MRILVVDDEKSNLEEIEDILNKSPVHAEGVYFENPVLALEAARRGNFDAAFLDIQMPGMTGLELAEEILNEKPWMDVVFITAYNHYATEAFEVQAMDYILKPIRPERVEKALKKLSVGKEKGGKTRKTLMICTLGEAKLMCGDEEIRWNRGKTGELFWFLYSYRGRKLHKDFICEALWPAFESKKALANLQVTLCRLRKDLECFDRNELCIRYQNNFYCLEIEQAHSDVDLFEKLADSQSKAELQKALTTYRGAFLEKEGWGWSEPEREKLRQKYERTIERLAGLYNASGESERLEALLSDYLEKETPDEKLVKLLMKAAVRNAGQAGLDRAYKMINERYGKELEMGIPAEVRREYARLRRGGGGEE